ncbi:hypothetical protein CL653_03720 [bacterium]|nr:hypothetical protein [bacterium]
MLMGPVSAQPSIGSSESLLSIRLASLGLRWTQDMDRVGDFWGSLNNGNKMRIYGTVFLGPDVEHQVKIAWDQFGMTGPWDTFRSRDQIGDTIFVEYQYNFK